jgi:hypothetical protein
MDQLASCNASETHWEQKLKISEDKLNGANEAEMAEGDMIGIKMTEHICIYLKKMKGKSINLQY